jgi:hypothetical protein
MKRNGVTYRHLGCPDCGRVCTKPWSGAVWCLHNGDFAPIPYDDAVAADFGWTLMVELSDSLVATLIAESAA